MKITLEAGKLARELKLLVGAAERQTTIPVLGMVLFTAAEDELVLTTTDLAISMRSRLSVKLGQAGTVAVPVYRLRNYVSALPDGDLSIESDSNHWIALTRGRSRARLAGMASESFPEIPHSPSPILELRVADLLDLISMTAFAISKEESRFTMQAVELRLSDEGALMCSTDGHRMAVAKAKLGSIGLWRGTIPSEALAQLRKLAGLAESADAMVAFSEDANHLFFQLEGRSLVARKLTGTFPDWERVLPRVEASSIELGRIELMSALARVGQFSDERSGMVRVAIGPGGLVLKAVDQEIGESEETVPAKYAGSAIEAGFKGAYLEDFLRACTSTQVKLLLKDSDSAGELRATGKDAEKYRYVVMPMRG